MSYYKIALFSLLLFLATMHLAYTVPVPEFEEPDEIDDSNYSFEHSRHLLPFDDQLQSDESLRLGSAEMRMRAKRKEQADQRMAMFLAFNNGGQEHFVHTTCPRQSKRGKKSTRKPKPSAFDDDSISHTIGQMLVDALKAQGKVIKSSHEDSHESVDENEIEGNHAEIISADSVEVEDVHDDAEIDLVDSLEDVPVHEDDLVDDPELDADIEDPIEGEEIDSDEITEPEVPSILAETPEVIADHEEIFASSSEENLNDADMVAEENNHTPFRATASTNAIHQKISSTTVQPIIQTNLVENTMSSSQIETLIQNLVGLSCRCTRSHDGICPLLKKPNDVESRVRISRNRPKNISNEGVQLKTSRKFPRRGPSAEKSSKETVSKQRRKQKVGNTINIKLGSSGRSGRPRKPKISNSEAHPNFERHRNLRLRTKPTPSKELHIILDDKENDIDDDFSDNDAIEEDHSSDNDEEELAPASDADEDLQFFRNHGSSSTTSTATTPHNKSPRNRRTRGGRRRTRLGPARKNASVSIEQLRPEESVADEANASIQRTQRGVQSSVPRRIRRRKVRRGAAQQEVQRIPGTPGNSEAAQDSVHREALSVGLVGDEIDSLAGKVKLESQNQVSAQTAGALLKQFSGLYQRFKRVIGNENVADVKILR